MLDPATLQARAKEATNAGRHRVARSLLLRAAARSTQDAELAAIEATLAYVLAEQGDTRAALDLCDSALNRPGLAPELAGVVTAQRATVRYRHGDRAGALADFRAALAVLTDPQQRGRALLNRSNLHLDAGQVESAIADLEAAGDEFARAALPVQQAKALHNLAYANLLRGDLVSALALFARVAPRISTLSPLAAAVCRMDRAEALFAAGRRDHGRALFEQSIAALQAARARRPLADAELALARHRAAYDLSGARALAASAARRYARLGLDVASLRAQALVVACTPHHTASGLTDAATLADDLRRRGYRREQVWVDQRLVHALVEHGRLDAARSRLRLVELPADPAGRLLVAGARFVLARAEGREWLARRYAASALDDFQRWQATFGSVELTASTSAIAEELCESALSSALADGRVTVAFEWAERARGLASRVVPVRPPDDPDARADLAELRVLAAAAGSERRRFELMAQVSERRWLQSGSGDVLAVPTLARVRDELTSADGALVAHLVDRDRLDALVVTGATARLVTLGSASRLAELTDGLAAELEVLATTLPASLATVVRSGLAARLAALDDYLLRPVARLMGDRRVVLVPSNPLRALPWTSLPGLRGRPVTVAASAAGWLAARSRGWASGPPGLVAGPGLERAADEVHAAAAHWPKARTLTGPAATVAAVRALTEASALLHVAAHGTHAGDNPLFSQVRLADGPWFGHDLADLDTGPSTVVLSACDVGRSTHAAGNEPLGLAVAWQHAGARAVIAATAPVSDAAAADLMPALHARLASGDPPADALASALESAGQLRAAFTCLGAGW